MKVGFVVNMHVSLMRPENCIHDYLTSLKNSVSGDYHIYIIDNGSDIETDFSNHGLKDKITYEYIENQWTTGVTGAWNIGTKLAIEDGCKIIIGFADDLIWNESINDFIDLIKNEYSSNIVYGPLSNAGGNSQTFDTAQNWIKNHNGYLHGFLWGFTDKLFYKVKQPNGDFLDTTLKVQDGKWGGQEFILNAYKSKYGIQFKIFGPTWIYHKKLTAWKEAREYEKGTEYHINQYKGKIK
tara:strand:- start:1503 stop:2219 length:717 start_codon:yes stop_codon:yes gene_type:complete